MVSGTQERGKGITKIMVKDKNPEDSSRLPKLEQKTHGSGKNK